MEKSLEKFSQLLNIIASSGVARILVRGEAPNKIFSKVARISVRGGDIQQKFT